MPLRMSTFGKILSTLGALFLATRFVVWIAFRGEAFAEVSLASTLYSPFFAPALGGAFVIQAWARPVRKEIGATALLGAVLAGAHAWGAAALHARTGIVLHVAFGLGLASMIVTGVGAARARGDARRAWLSILVPSAILPAFVAVSAFFLGMTALLHPLVYDASVYAADDLFGWQPSFAAARLFAAAPYIAAVCRLVYWNLPLALAFVYGARRFRDPETSDGVLVSFVAIGCAGFLLYHAYPVVGPVFFLGKGFPGNVPSPPNATEGYLFAASVPRNCMPSLHTAWALLLYWQSRPFGRFTRALAGGWLALTVLGTLGFGYHYAMDLAVAAPFTLAVTAALMGTSDARDRERWIVVGTASALTAGWFFVLRFFPPASSSASALRWGLAAITVIASFWAERRLDARALPAATDRAVPTIDTSPNDVVIATVFFISGFSGLIYEVVFAKSLTLTFGSTATASTTVLATYMGGISLGAWIGGELGERRSDPLRIYALCEVAIAIYCAATPWLFTGVRALYVAIASGMDPGRPMLVLLQAALGALVLLPPTTLMGITMPVLTKQFAARAELGRAIGLLYGANTLGAALGAWLTGYVVLSFLGVTGTTWLAVLANLSVGLLALRLSVRLGQTPADPSARPSDAPRGDPAARVSGIIAAVILGAGGLITLALETTDIHLLAIVAGNSAYAFALMLFAFLVGLGLGASFARRMLGAHRATLLHLALLELALSAAILIGVHGWEQIPAYFASFAGFPLVRTFGSRELIRFIVCSLMMIPPAFFIGTLFPMAMDLVTRAADNPVRATGRASALNTLGNITGAIVGGFLLVPRLGSLSALEILAAAAFALGLVPLVSMQARDRGRVVAAAAFVVVLFTLEPKSFDYDRLGAGTNVYFQPAPHGHVIAHAESLDGGLTTVNEAYTPEGVRVLTLLTNGKFQGDTAGEMKAQYGYALYPLLHTTARDEALVIGLGTGVSAATVHWAGFRHLDIAELSRDIAALTDTYFSSVTGRVLAEPGVDLHVTDGRNFLLLTKTQYDLVTIEVTSIWFAGAASLYNQEFYQLVKSRLRPKGVLQQWIQLHRIGVEDVVSILGTVRSEFPHVWLYFTGSQGLLVACVHDCRPKHEALARIEAAPDLERPLSSIRGGVGRLVGDRLLSPASIDRFLGEVAAMGLETDQLVSTDDNLFLEYNTPRGNVRDYESSLRRNVALLRNYLPASPLDETLLTEHDLAAMRPEPETGLDEPPGLTGDARHGKTEP